jgi:tetratricopeptide (TPR) repeat protein
VALSNLGQGDEAIACFDELLQINPRDIPALLVKGDILSRRGMRAQAIESFDRVLTLDPVNKDALALKRKVF